MRKKVAETLLDDMLTYVYVTDGYGGRGESPSEDTKHAVIEIGIGNEYWRGVFQVLVHEMLELLMTHRHLSYEAVAKWRNNTSNRMFVFNHSQFEESIVVSCWAITDVMDIVKKEWKAFHKAKK